jgi:DNA (cytosine-5)-methyltransferase 1
LKPRLLDLFCGAGGCTKGYQQAGFYVVGVDINPQPNYCGDEFYQGDALEFPLEGFDAIHASPPCQAYSVITPQRNAHLELIGPTRDRLKESGAPFVIENVGGAKAALKSPIMLCGAQFGLKVYRHRWFERLPFLMSIPHVNHRDSTPANGRGLSPKGFISVAGSGGVTGLTSQTILSTWSNAMGIDWMTRQELSQAIPPAFTEFIGEQLLAHLGVPA